MERPIDFKRTHIGLLLLLLTLLLVACGGPTSPQSKAPTPTPTMGPGQQLLNTVAQKLNTAQTLHGIFDIQITGQAFNGTVSTEVWNATPGKYRTVVLQSSIAQFSTGSVDVSNGKTVWQYNPQQKVVYSGPVASNTSSGTPTATGGNGNGTGSDVQFILGLVQSVFSRSDATQVSASATVNGHSADEIQIVSQGLSAGKNSGNGLGNLSYTGNIFIDKNSNLPIQVNLTIQGFGQVTLNLPTLTLNQPIPDSTFTFVVPTGVKTRPLQQASTTSDNGALTLAQAQQQAGYHLLSIPSSQSGYTLTSINALGSPGSQIYTLNYTKGNSSFTIAEGKSLANLPQNGGQQVAVRGTHGSLSTANNGSTTLTWTENGVGITITGPFSSDQMMSIAQVLL